MTRTRRIIAQALTLLLGFGTAAQGLTIYRIGGSTLPPPELPDGADFVQLDWQAAADSDHGAGDTDSAEGGDGSSAGDTDDD